MHIDERAPVVATDELRVAASPETVFDLLADVGRWPRWNPEVRSVTLAGLVRPGSEFRWSVGRGIIVSRVLVFEPGREFGWIGRLPGIQAVHVWRLDEDRGGTRIRSEESWDGLLPRIARGALRGQLESFNYRWLERIRTEVERGAGAVREEARPAP